MFQKTTNKLTALLLTLVMLLTLVPAVSLTAYATGTTVTTKTELMNAVKQSGTVILGADIVLTDDSSNWDYYMVYIKSGVEITLDLNGHVLDRSRIDLGQSTSYGWAIENKGTLIIKDSNPSTTHTLYKKSEAWRPNVYTVEDKSEDSGYTVAMTVTGGAIIGAYNSDGGGIKNTGTLTLEGGTICGNEGTTMGGGVYNQGTFTMTGGTICKNNSTGGYKWGGGGVQNDGTFIMTGGTITENTCKNSYNQLRGGGVYNAGTFKISGSPVVSGNSNGNVFLMSFSQHNGKKIEVVGALNDDAEVGVYPEDEPPITVTTGYKTYMDGKDQTKYFSSDRAGWFVMLDSDGEVLLSKPITVATPTITPAGGEYTEAQTVTISCETEGATIYYTTDGTDPTANSTEYTAPFTVSETSTVKAFAVKDTENSEAASATYTINIPVPTYSVTVIGGTNTTPDSENYLTQTEITGDMTTVTYTAKEGYLFPALSSAYGTKDGVTVTLSADRKTITVSGTPTADVEVSIPDAAQESGTTGGDTPSQQTGNTDGSDTSPHTGDNSHLGFWIAIMILSLCALAAALFIGKKKRVFDR